MFSIRKTIAALTLLGGMLVLSNSASASNYSTGKCYLKTVIVYETVRKPVVNYVTRYDHCGKPYQAKIVTHQFVRVAFKKQVEVCH